MRPAPSDIRAALLAMSAGAGGCIDIAGVADTTLHFFPAVRAVRGVCIAEHGDTLRSLVAIDPRANTILLDSPSAFTYLLIQAGPVRVEPADAVKYAFDAMRLSGRLPIDATFAQGREAVPEAILQRLGIKREHISESRVVDAREASVTVWVSAFTQREVRSFKVGIDRRTGHIEVFAP